MPGGSFPEAEERFGKLLALIETLRDPVSGCPWDIRQTKADVGRYLLEETCEVLDAVDRNSPAAMREELGDLLFMILFLARIAEEENLFGIGGILDEITAKMIRRHPHVFASSPELQAEEVARQWEQIKLQEKNRPARASTLDGIPRNIPALNRAQKTVQRAAQAGFAWPDADSALAKVREELGEVEEAMASGPKGQVEQEIGDLLFAVVGLARTMGLDAESALRGTTARFTERFRRLEARLDSGLADATPDEMIRIWREVATES